MRRLVVAIAALALFVVLALLIAAIMVIGSGESTPSRKALREIPEELLPLYQAAARTCEGMDWTLLAAIHRTETGFGRGPAVSSAGARGPMQFMPATWTGYGLDADGDRRADVNDLEDAVFSAANYLCANGAGDPSRVRSAVFNYNHDLDYVDEVLTLAVAYGVAQPVPGSAYARSQTPRAILNNPRIILSELARTDVERGEIDGRVLAVMELASRHFTIAVSVLKSGHSPYVAGTSSFSNHYFGRAADIFSVNGHNVSPLNADARALTLWLAQLPEPLRPSEVGSPFFGALFPGAFTDAAHQDHIHIGFD